MFSRDSNLERLLGLFFSRRALAPSEGDVATSLRKQRLQASRFSDIAGMPPQFGRYAVNVRLVDGSCASCGNRNLFKTIDNSVSTLELTPSGKMPD
jgi:hypothetical protein